MSAPIASTSSTPLVSFAQDIDYSQMEGFKQYKTIVQPLFWALLSSLIFKYASPSFPSLLLVSVKGSFPNGKLTTIFTTSRL